MTTYTGTQDVQPGFYLNTKKFSVTTLDRQGPLPGTPDDTYRRVPLLLMLAASPLVGLMYVIFLPFIGFAAVTYLAATKAREFAGRVATETGRVRRPGWVPALAFFSRSKHHDVKPTASHDEQHDAWTEEVEKKLEEGDRTAR